MPASKPRRPAKVVDDRLPERWANDVGRRGQTDGPGGYAVDRDVDAGARPW